MAELKLGAKHECSSCGTKFYDLGKAQKICPHCGTDQEQKETEDTSEEARPEVRKEPTAKAEPDLAEEDDLEDEDEDEDEDV